MDEKTEIRCEVCNEKFNSQEEYNSHWKYILETPMRQYNEAVEKMNERLLKIINKNNNAYTSR